MGKKMEGWNLGVLGDVGEMGKGICEFREFMEGREELGRVGVVRQVRGRVFEDGEARVVEWAKRVVREFPKGELFRDTFFDYSLTVLCPFSNPLHFLSNSLINPLLSTLFNSLFNS